MFSKPKKNPYSFFKHVFYYISDSNYTPKPLKYEMLANLPISIIFQSNWRERTLVQVQLFY